MLPMRRVSQPAAWFNRGPIGRGWRVDFALLWQVLVPQDLRFAWCTLADTDHGSLCVRSLRQALSNDVRRHRLISISYISLSPLSRQRLRLRVRSSPQFFRHSDDPSSCSKPTKRFESECFLHSIPFPKSVRGRYRCWGQTARWRRDTTIAV